MVKAWSLDYIRKIPRSNLVILFVTTIGINVLSLVFPLTMKQVFGRVIPNKSEETLIVLVIACIAALIPETVLRHIKVSSSKWVASKFEYYFNGYIIRKILSADLSKLKDEKYGSLLEKLSFVGKLASFYATGFYMSLIDLPFALVFFVFLYILGKQIIIYIIIVVAIYLVVIAFFAPYFRKHRELFIKNNVEQTNRLISSLENIHFIKACNLEEFEISKFRSVAKDVSNSGYEINKLTLRFNNISALFNQLLTFTVLISGGYYLINGTMLLGELTACSLLTGRLIQPIHSLVSTFIQRSEIRLLEDNIAAITKITERYTADTPFFPPDIDGTVEFKNVSYGKLKNVDFKIYPRKFVRIDHDFHGYKDIIEIVLGIESSFNGKVLIDSLDIKEWNMGNLKGKIEYISQDVKLFNGTIIENITFFDKTRESEAVDAAKLTLLDSFVLLLPNGYNTRLENHSVNILPAGMLQRLNLARALLYRPRILIIDKIEQSMDNETNTHFIKLLTELKGMMTIIAVSNSDAIKKLADESLQNIVAGGQA